MNGTVASVAIPLQTGDNGCPSKRPRDVGASGAVAPRNEVVMQPDSTPASDPARVAALIILACGPEASEPHPRERHGLTYHGCVAPTSTGYRCCRPAAGWLCAHHSPDWVGDSPPAFSTNVYFILAERSGLIKIGKADDVARRYQGLAAGSPEPLTLLRSLPAEASLERMLHLRLGDARRHGEWFDAEAVRDLIDQSSDEEVREFAYGRRAGHSPRAWARGILADITRLVPSGAAT